MLRPQCWICAAVNHQIVGGTVAVLLFLLTGWFATAGFVALFVFLFMVHLIIFPEKTYTLQMEDKTLLIAIYASDFLRRHRKDSKRKRFIIRTIACHADGFAKRYGRTAKYSDMTTACAATAFFWLSLIPQHGPLSATDLKTGVFWGGNSAIMFLPNG